MPAQETLEALSVACGAGIVLILAGVVTALLPVAECDRCPHCRQERQARQWRPPAPDLCPVHSLPRHECRDLHDEPGPPGG